MFKNKSSKFVIVIAIIAVVILLSLILLVPCLKFLKNRKQVNNFFDKPNVSTFVTEVQEYMINASEKFTNDLFNSDFEFTPVEYTSDNSDLNGDIENKIYKINLDKNGEFTSIIIYDEDFCYNISLVDHLTIDKTMIVSSDVYKHSKKDNLIDGCQGKKFNK